MNLGKTGIVLMGMIASYPIVAFLFNALVLLPPELIATRGDLPYDTIVNMLGITATKYYSLNSPMAIIVYLALIYFHNKLSMSQKVVWALFVIVASFISMPLFWYLHIKNLETSQEH